MSTFVVTPSSLMELAAALVRVDEDLTGMKTTAKGYDGELGSPDLDSALSAFGTEWTYGVSEITKEMGTVVERLMQAAQAYAEQEQAVANAADPQSGGQ